MKLSELIEKAATALSEYGDIPVIVKEGGCGCCSMGDGLAAHGIVEGVWVYDLEEGPGEVPVAFRLEG